MEPPASSSDPSEMPVAGRIGLGLIKAVITTAVVAFAVVGLFAAITDTADDIGDRESGLIFVLLFMLVVFTVGPASLIVFTAWARGKNEMRPSVGLAVFGAVLLAPIALFAGRYVVGYGSDRGLSALGWLGAVGMVAGLASLVAIAARFVSPSRGVTGAAVFFGVAVVTMFGAAANAEAHWRLLEADALAEQEISLYLFADANPQPLIGTWEIHRIHHPFSAGVDVSLTDGRGSHLLIEFLRADEADLCAERACVPAFVLADGTDVQQMVGGESSVYSVAETERRWRISTSDAVPEAEVVAVLEALKPVTIDRWLDLAPPYGAPG